MRCVYQDFIKTAKMTVKLAKTYSMAARNVLTQTLVKNAREEWCRLEEKNVLNLHQTVRSSTTVIGPDVRSVVRASSFTETQSSASLAETVRYLTVLNATSTRTRGTTFISAHHVTRVKIL